MKRVLGIFFTFLLLSSVVFADEDLWTNFGDKNFYGNSGAVSDKDFDKALESKKRTKKPKQFKGESIQESNETEVINQLPKELPVVCITTPVQVNETAVLPVGHYQVTSEQRGGKIYLKLYQAHYLMAEIEAQETLDDFDEPEVHFAKFILDKDNQYKIIFGSIDYNAFAVVQTPETY